MPLLIAALLPVIQAVIAGASPSTVLVASLSAASRLIPAQTERDLFGSVGHLLEQAGADVVAWMRSRPAYNGPYTSDEARERAAEAIRLYGPSTSSGKPDTFPSGA